ncbi:MAG: hypothetical protein PH343_02455, partial [Nitrospira sp.]|nr:hypothetical protein [Nitrospira sp.]
MPHKSNTVIIARKRQIAAEKQYLILLDIDARKRLLAFFQFKNLDWRKTKRSTNSIERRFQQVQQHSGLDTKDSRNSKQLKGDKTMNVTKKLLIVLAVVFTISTLPAIIHAEDQGQSKESTAPQMKMRADKKGKHPDMMRALHALENAKQALEKAAH